MSSHLISNVKKSSLLSSLAPLSVASSLHLSLLSVSLLDLASGPQKGQAAPAHRRTEGLGRRRRCRRLPRWRRGRPRPGGRYPCYSQDQLVHEGNLIGASKDAGKLLKLKLTHLLGDGAVFFHNFRHFRCYIIWASSIS